MTKSICKLVLNTWLFNHFVKHNLCVYNIIAVMWAKPLFATFATFLSSTVFHSLSSCSLCLSQFEDFVMDICFEILDNSKNALKNLAKDIERRCDPIYVSRMITTMVTVSSKQLTQKLRIWASFMFSLCNSYTYFLLCNCKYTCFATQRAYFLSSSHVPEHVTHFFKFFIYI